MANESFYDLSKILDAPVVVIEWLSSNFDFNNVIGQPILVASLNDWYLNTTISQPSLTFTGDSGETFSLEKTDISMSLSASFSSGNTYSFSQIIRPPNLVATMSGAYTYSLTKTISNISLVASIASNNYYVFSSTIPQPEVSSEWHNDQINSTTISTFVINTMNSAHSTYSNFGFNSYFKLANSYYGINSTGVWKLTGSLDNVTPIQTEVDTPISSFDKQGLKACSDAILFGRLAGDMEIVTVNDEQEEREGFIVRDDGRQGLHRIRVKIPKGLKGSTWQFKIKNVDGSDFAINNFEVFLRELQRIR